MSFKTSSRQLTNTDETPKDVPSEEGTPLDAPARAEAPEAEPPVEETQVEETRETETAEAETSGAEAAEAETPEVKVVEGKTPEAEALEAETPEAKTPQAEAPETQAPEAEAADEEAPQAETPEAQAPQVASAEASALEAEASEAEAPEAEASDQAVAVPSPEAPAASDTSDASDASDAPEASNAPETPGTPDASDTPSTSDTPATPQQDRRRPPWRGWRAKYPIAARVLAWVLTLLAGAVVLVALLMPDRIELVKLSAFTRLPVEAIFGAAVLIVLPRKPRIIVAALAGLSLGALTVLNLLDIGFNEYLGRGFNVVLDWALFSDAQSYVQDTFGRTRALLAVVAIVVLVLVLLTLTTLSVVRLANLMGRHTVIATRTTLVLGTAWVTCSALSVQFTGVPVASDHTAALIQDRARRVRATLRDEAAFAKIAKKDDFANTPPDQLLTGLRGKDMMITFIESYGRSAIEDPVMAPGVDATLTAENDKLTKAGFAAKSGWLTSATYGGSSWLGHSTFLSGLWISNQQRYRTVTAGERLTLPGAFKKTGAWDTVGIMPGVQKAWPEQNFYGIDKVYDSHKLGYKGPEVQLVDHARPVRADRVRAPGAQQEARQAADVDDHPDLQPPAVGADPQAGPAGPGRRRVDLQRDREGRQEARGHHHLLPQVQGGVRQVHPVLGLQPHQLPGEVRQQEHRADLPRRPPAHRPGQRQPRQP